MSLEVLSSQQLICKRLQLRHQMGEILRDQGRYYSEEFDICVRAIDSTSHEICRRGIDIRGLLRALDDTDRAAIHPPRTPVKVPTLAQIIPFPQLETVPAISFEPVPDNVISLHGVA